MKKALLYNPYLDVLGGGERHILSVMRILVEAGYAVDIAWDDKDVINKINEVLRIDTQGMTCIPNFFAHSDKNEKNQKTAEYDILVYVTDGSYFFSKAKKNFIFSMYPSKKLYTLLPLNWMKLLNFEIIANGDFTAEYVGKWLHKKVHTLHPYIEDDFINNSGKKSKIIMSVGRIFKHLHSKRQDVLIKAFIRLKEKHEEFKDFELYLVGGLKSEDKEYYDELKQLADNRNDIVFKVNVSYKDMCTYYDRAQFYWHAGGYGLDEKRDPEGVEHFGISPLEGMASGCVTLCHNSAGPKRYIQNGVNGFLYEDINDLVSKTSEVYSDMTKLNKVSIVGKEFVKNTFAYPAFKKNVVKIFSL